MRVALRATIRTNNCNAGTQVLDKVPACTRNGEKVHVVVDIPQDFQCRMVLEEQIHLDTQSSDVLEHVRELHVFRIRSKAVETKQS